MDAALANICPIPDDEVCRFSEGAADDFLAADGAAGLLRGRDLGLQRRRVGVDPLQLREVPVEDADYLAELYRGGRERERGETGLAVYGDKDDMEILEG